ncbi:MAG: ATP-binding protein [Pyrinomonadaceae bacterium]
MWQGSGLGLSLVDHIVKAHEGRLKVESDIGRGSAFTIYLPVATDELDQEPRSAAVFTQGISDGPIELGYRS